VQFRRTVAKGGRVRVDDEVWDDTKFANAYDKMRTLEQKLDTLIQLLKPVEVPPFDWFSALSSPTPLHRVLNATDAVAAPMSEVFPGKLARS
jgi:hypothetical protein